MLALRERQKRNLLATLLLSQGVPMLVAGDEIGRTQHGNNNAYCQDNEISWIDWTPTPQRSALRDFVQRLIALRRAHPSLRRRRFLSGRGIADGALKDVLWLRPDGQEMTQTDWEQPHARSLGMLLAGRGIEDCSARSEPVRDDDLLLLFNADANPLAFHLPVQDGVVWALLLDTAAEPGATPPPQDPAAVDVDTAEADARVGRPERAEPVATAEAGESPALTLAARSLAVLHRPADAR